MSQSVLPSLGDAISLKMCKGCKQTKHQDNFYQETSYVRGRKYHRFRKHCKKCQIKSSHDNYFKNHLAYKKKHNDWYHNHRRKEVLKKVYGLTTEQFETMKINQKGLCLICAEPPKSFHVDHDHKTGKVRGLLCRICNAGLGYFHDHVGRLASAITYLNKNAAPSA